jgi:hypothetical protein
MFEAKANEIRDALPEHPELEKMDDMLIFRMALREDFGTGIRSDVSKFLGQTLGNPDPDIAETAHHILGRALDGGYKENAQSFDLAQRNAGLTLIQAMDDEFGTNARENAFVFIANAIIYVEHGKEAGKQASDLLTRVLQRNIQYDDKSAGEYTNAQTNAAKWVISFLGDEKISKIMLKILTNSSAANMDEIKKIGKVWSHVLQSEDVDKKTRLMGWLTENEGKLNANWKLENEVVTPLILSYLRICGQKREIRGEEINKLLSVANKKQIPTIDAITAFLSKTKPKSSIRASDATKKTKLTLKAG